MRRPSAFLFMIPLLVAGVVPAAAQSPTEELLPAMVTEEVEPGVYRVDHDGFRDLSSADYWGVFAGQDGSIWIDHDGYPVRLGVADDQAWQLGGWDFLMDLEVASDGTVWTLVVNDEESTLRSFDGEMWTTHRTVELPRFTGDVEVTSEGVVWAALADGTLGHLDADGSWHPVAAPTIEPETEAAGSSAAAEPSAEDEFANIIQEFGFIVTESGLWVPYFGGAPYSGHDAGIWHYTDGAWEHITYGGPNTGTMRDEVFWGLGPGTNGDVILYRHDATGWTQWSLREYDMLPGGWTIGPIAVAPDGSFWAGWLARSEEDWCQGVSHFDGKTWVRYLPGMCIPWRGMAVVPDGSMWVHAFEREDEEEPFAGSGQLYAIIPEAVAATE